MVAALQVFVILIGCSAPIIIVGVVYYLKKRLEHKQIMAAIEKGTPLSEIIPPKPSPAGPAWIKYVALGVGMFIIGFALIVGRGGPETLIAIVLCGAGAAWIIRGLLHRKYYLKNELSAKNNAGENKNSA